MSNHYFFCPFDQGALEAVICDPDEVQHLSKVLRLKIGDPVALINGQGGYAQGHLSNTTPTTARIILENVSFVADTATFKVTLACAIPKKAKFETIIEKCTELGVHRIIPMITHRTEIDLKEDQAHKKMERFTRVIVNAAKQSGRLWFPKLEPLTHFDQAIKAACRPGVQVLIPWLEGERVLLSEILLNPASNEFIVFIGPEGDFTQNEVDQAVNLGAVPVSLGPNVLKVDTAAIAVVSRIIYA